METLRTAAGVRISWERHGRAGTPLILVHGAFSDHRTNWQFVIERLAADFDVYAIARRGRGKTDATQGHSVLDEADDLIALIQAIDKPVFLAGHSYGAHVALAAAQQVSSRVERLILYEAPSATLISDDVPRRLQELAAADQWEEFCTSFFVDVLSNPVAEIDALHGTLLWQQILDDAPASLHDVLAVARHRLDEVRTQQLTTPTLLQIGSESPRAHYLTDRLMELLPDVRLDVLHGQAHEGMTTAPELYVKSLTAFLQVHSVTSA